MGTIKHGIESHQLYAVYTSMISRCYNPLNKAYKNYGARGVLVCDEWRNNIMSFYNWAISNGWESGLHLDKDKLSPHQVGVMYSPEFCCFLTRKENNRYKRNSRMIEYNGEIKSLPEWAHILSLDFKFLQGRYKQGWTKNGSRLFETARRKIKEVEYNGIMKTVPEWCKELNINYRKVSRRIYRGWQVKAAFETPFKNVTLIKITI